MNKSAKKMTLRALSLLLCGAMFLPTAVSCGDEEGGKKPSDNGANSNNVHDTPAAVKYDTENYPVVFALSQPDGNFNPFFATSGPDNEVIGMTQIGMLASDAKGNPVCGENEATVALDYNVTMYDRNGNVSSSGDLEGKTVYDFVIKNGIKFSDGETLTMKDVLFNFYVYLDAAYTGSATVYSTDIQGLNAYQEDDPDLGDDVEVNSYLTYYQTAKTRINNIKRYVDEDEVASGTTEQALKADVAMIQQLFREEVESDWTTHFGTQSSYETEYKFTENWEVFYFVEGLVKVQTRKTETGTEKLRDESDKNTQGEGRYFTTLDPDHTIPDEVGEAQAQYLIDEMEDYVDDNLQAYMTENECDEATAKAALERECAIETVYTAYSDNISEILDYWATGGEVLERFIGEARSAANSSDGTYKVENISGIQPLKLGGDNDVTFSGVFNGKAYNEEHDVLRIVINGVDPKAIWNFSIGIAPMHYYSNQDAIENTPHGVKKNDSDFFANVLGATEKSAVPVGAGVYQATNEGATAFGKHLKGSDFYKNNVLYFQRNNYFDTVGGDEVYNAKIKYFRYAVVGEDNVMNRLVSQEIHYGEPNAKQNNIDAVTQAAHLAYKTYKTNGYGYIGVNPEFVPNVKIRRAIMKAMDTGKILDYYQGGLAEIIYRPMSSTSWAYPDNAKEYDSVAYDDTTNYTEIKKLVAEAGYYQAPGELAYRNDDGDTLEFEFVIAGSTTDHPAFNVFTEAERILEKCGFDISVVTSPSALKDLAQGNLAVWAAAWSSGIDPDMYQVYHKDSNATSVNNWNYKTILTEGSNDPNNKWYHEYTTIMALSDKIDAGRQTTNQDERIEIYGEALDLIMELAVEFPTYQRSDLVVYNSDVINPNSLNQNPSANESVVSKIWALNFN